MGLSNFDLKLLYVYLPHLTPSEGFGPKSKVLPTLVGIAHITRMACA